MHDLGGPSFGRAIGAGAGLLLLVLLVPVLWVFVAFNSKYRTCVQLGNGLNLGYEAVLDLSRPYFKPIAVPRFADGTPVIRDDLWALYVTETTIYGRTFTVADGSDFEFAWRLDTGVVFRDENQEKYEALVVEAGDANWDVNIGSIGTGSLLNELIKRPRFNVGRCPTALITW